MRGPLAFLPVRVFTGREDVTDLWHTQESEYGPLRK